MKDKYPFFNIKEAASYREFVYPHFKTFSIRENSNGNVGFWNNQYGTFHKFDSGELKLLEKMRVKHAKTVARAVNLLYSV